MKFLIDAQLPRRLARWLSGEGHDVLHTLDLPEGNRTSDVEINRISIAQERVVISKDSDFVDAFLLGQGPHRLLLISTGNITNNELLALIERNLEQIIEHCEASEFVELNQVTLTSHM